MKIRERRKNRTVFGMSMSAVRRTGPIFLTYRTNPILSYIVCHVKEESPVYDFEAEDGIRHRVWIVGDDLAVAAIEKAFAAVDALYIADGHHRAASAFKVGMKRRRTHPAYNGTEEFNYFLAVLFPEDELKIMDYNRLVKSLNGWSKEDFLERIRRDFTVEYVGKEAVSPSKKGEFGMYLDHEWYRLNVHPDKTSEDPVDGLDVSILQMNLLDPVLGIEDPRTDENIEFVGGIRGLGELENGVMKTWWWLFQCIRHLSGNCWPWLTRTAHAAKIHMVRTKTSVWPVHSSNRKIAESAEYAENMDIC